jgi:hypothetical protein
MHLKSSVAINVLIRQQLVKRRFLLEHCRDLNALDTLIETCNHAGHDHEAPDEAEQADREGPSQGQKGQLEGPKWQEATTSQDAAYALAYAAGTLK